MFDFPLAHSSFLEYEGHEIVRSFRVPQKNPMAPLSLLSTLIKEEPELKKNLRFCDDGSLIRGHEEVDEKLRTKRS